jgi:hypothetical protein
MIHHFDAWHNPILGYLDMLSYFKGDFSSLLIIKNYAPIRYVCIPQTTIELLPESNQDIDVFLAYPGGVRRHSLVRSQNTLEALRRLWRSPEVSWRHYKDGPKICFIHKAKVIHVTQARGW